MSIHQVVNSIGLKIYNGFWYKGRNWHTHMHKSLEFAYVESGTLEVTVGRKNYTAERGKALLIFPYQPHSYTAAKNTCYFVSVFSEDYCESFSTSIKKYEAANPIFKPSKSTEQFLKEKIMLPPPDFTHFYKLHNPPLFNIKAAVYAIISDFSEKVKLENKTKSYEPLYKMLNFIEENFTEDITLKTVADAISYDYHYLSRIFNENFNINFKTILNQYRCERAAHQLISTDINISQIAFNCGFQSLRSFNRIFMEFSGCTPTHFRNNHEKQQL